MPHGAERPHPEFSSQYLLTQLGVRLSLFVIFMSTGYVQPYVREVTPELAWRHSYPITAAPYISSGALYRLIYICPVLTITPWFVYRRSWLDLQQAALASSLGLLINGLATDTLKVVVGQLRPDFIERCYGRGGRPHPGRYCTGDPQLVMEGRRSFPSGHSSFCSCLATFASLYWAGKLRVFAAAPAAPPQPSPHAPAAATPSARASESLKSRSSLVANAAKTVRQSVGGLVRRSLQKLADYKQSRRIAALDNKDIGRQGPSSSVIHILPPPSKAIADESSAKVETSSKMSIQTLEHEAREPSYQSSAKAETSSKSSRQTSEYTATESSSETSTDSEHDGGTAAANGAPGPLSAIKSQVPGLLAAPIITFSSATLGSSDQSRQNLPQHSVSVLSASGQMLSRLKVSNMHSPDDSSSSSDEDEDVSLAVGPLVDAVRWLTDTAADTLTTAARRSEAALGALTAPTSLHTLVAPSAPAAAPVTLLALLAPPLAAVAVGVSRVMDHRHHWEDVVVGYVIGAVSATVGYLSYYRPPTSPDADRPASARHRSFVANW